MGNSDSAATEKAESARQQILCSTIMEFFRTVLVSEPPRPELESLVLAVLSKLKEIELREDTVILEEGKPAVGIFFLLSGSADILSQSTMPGTRQPIVLSTMEAPGYFGELSTLHDIPCTVSVRVQVGSSLVVIEATDFRSEFPELAVVDLEKICIARSYLPSGPHIRANSVLSGISQKVLKKTPTFANWEDDAVVSMAKLLPQLPLQLFPSDSVLCQEGDPIDSLIVLVKGEVKVFKNVEDMLKDEPLMTFRAKEYPFPIGAQSLFNHKGKQRILLVTSTPCIVIPLPGDFVRKFMTANAAKWPVMALTREKTSFWKRRITSGGNPVYLKYPAILQVEVLYCLLRDLPELENCEPGCVFCLAEAAQPMLLSAGHVVLDADDISLSQTSCAYVYVIHGKINLEVVKGEQATTLISYSGTSCFSYQAWMPANARLVVDKEESLLVTLLQEDVKFALRLFPNSFLEMNAIDAATSNEKLVREVPR